MLFRLTVSRASRARGRPLASSLSLVPLLPLPRRNCVTPVAIRAPREAGAPQIGASIGTARIAVTSQIPDGKGAIGLASDESDVAEWRFGRCTGMSLAIGLH